MSCFALFCLLTDVIPHVVTSGLDESVRDGHGER